VKEGDDARVLIHCHAGCPTEAVIAELGLRMDDLHPQRDRNDGDGVAYEYETTPRMRVLRGPNKKFLQQHQSPDGTWTWGTKGITKVPYRLSKLSGVSKGGLVFVCEGEKDADRLSREGLVATTNPGGAGKFLKSFGPYFDGLSVVVVPDNDEPGRNHAADVATKLSAHAADVKVIQLPDLPEQGDVSDFLDAGHSADDLCDLVDRTEPWDPEDTRATTPPESKPVDPTTVCEAEALFVRWLEMKDLIPLRAVLAAVAAHRRGGDPCDLMVVGGSGSTKTVLVDALSTVPGVIGCSHITGEAALLSGTSKKERAADATGGLLRQVGSDGILALKDFTTILSMNRDARAQLLAAMREVHDGYWARNVGADGGRRLEWKGRCSMVAASTTAIDTAHAVLASLGNRFFLVRTGRENPYAMARRSMRNAGGEALMRGELREVVAGLFVGEAADVPELTESELDRLAAMAQFVSQARSPVERDFNGQVALVGATDAPTRAARVFAQLLSGARSLGYSDNEAWQIVVRVALDSVPGLRRRALGVLVASEDYIETAVVAKELAHPTRTVLRALEDLAGHGLLLKEWKGTGHPTKWVLREQARRDADAFGDRAFFTQPDIPGTPREDGSGDRARNVRTGKGVT
jgi:hypothetical protein